MSIELQQVRRRIQGTRQIRKVTSALQRVSSARLTGDRRHIALGQDYTRALQQLVLLLARDCGYPDDPCLTPRPWKQRCLIVCGSDRGLCGGYNTAIMDHLAREMEGHREQTDLLVIGKVIHHRAQRAGYEIHHRFHQPPRAMRHTLTGRIADIAEARLRDGDVQRVDMLYTQFQGGLLQETLMIPLLPLDPAALPDVELPAVVSYNPSPDVLLERMLPLYLEHMIDQALLHAAASESAARQAAMSRASENAGEILRELDITYSRLRQESITTEMIELAGGIRAEDGT